jgi:hypothetical protein
VEGEARTSPKLLPTDWFHFRETGSGILTMTDSHAQPTTRGDDNAKISYATAVRSASVDVASWCLSCGHDERTERCSVHGPRIAVLRALAAVVDQIIEAVATDERALTLTDPSARSSEQQYAEEEIISAAVSIAAGYQPTDSIPTAAGLRAETIGGDTVPSPPSGQVGQALVAALKQRSDSNGR